jgi:hypothetical protein
MLQEIIDSLKDINLIDFIVSNMLWELMFLILFGLIFKKIYSIYKLHRNARTISIKLLSNNRPSFGGKSPLYLADRFIDIWNWKHNQLFVYDNKQTYTPRVFSKCYFNEVAIHKELKELGLIEIKDDSQKSIYIPKNKLNNLIYKKCKSYLIKYQFDTLEQYKMLEK